MNCAWRWSNRVCAIKQDRPEVLSQPHDWIDGQLDLDPERLVFINQTSTVTNMTRSHGRYAGATYSDWLPAQRGKDDDADCELAYDRHDRAK